MKGEEGRHECASPASPRQGLQDEKQQCRIEQVKEEIDEVMKAGVKAEKADIEHVGEPRQRVPVRRGECREGPPDSLPRESLPDDGIVRHVERIVIIDEAEIPDLPVDPCRDEGQKKKHRQHAAHRTGG